MKNYKNGIVIWEEKELIYRKFIVEYIANQIKSCLKEINKSFDFIQCETSILTDKEDINNEYFLEKDYIFQTKDFILRPETTKGSYFLARELLSHYETKLPVVIWQFGKSFRNEQDKTLKNMRLKEFYQLEFQVLYSNTTKADYPSILKEFVFNLFRDEFKSLLTKKELSDRLPSYSLETTDILIDNLEVCSMSLRNDFEENISNFEIAIGLDRLIYLKFKDNS